VQGRLIPVDSGDATNVMYGDDGHDRLVGGPHFDTAYGGPGDDVLVAGGGNTSRMYGQGGKDRIVLMVGDDHGADGGAGRHVLDMRQAAQAVALRLDWNPGSLFFGQVFSGTIIGVEDAYGGPHADLLVGNDGCNRLRDQAGDDILWGRGQRDRLLGKAGNDTLYGEAGDDYLIGGPGYDKLIAGSGWDACSGEERYECEVLMATP